MIQPSALVFAALLAHQASRLAQHGFGATRHTYAPVFGIRLPAPVTATAQLAALPAALAVTVFAPHPQTGLIALACVVLWLLTLQRRMANHVWMGFVAVAVLTFLPAALAPLFASDLLVGLYLSAAVFKMHGEYLTGPQSPGRVMTAIYLRLLGLPQPPAVLAAAPAAVIAAELAVPVLLLIPHGGAAALIVAILMHLAFGVSGNFEFSIVALALWSIAAGDVDGVAVPSPADPVWLLIPVCAAAGWLLGRSPSGPRAVPVQLRDAGQGATYGFFCAFALAGSITDIPAPLGARLVHSAVTVGFVVNFLLVVSGLKLDWSFAMFSGLRPFGSSWLQRGSRAGQPRYFTLTLPDRIPSAWLREVSPAFLYQATRADQVVHEAVAFHLEAMARRSGRSLEPRLVAARECDGVRQLMPVGGASVAPRRRVLLFPGMVSRSFTTCHLG
ncbi:hypothetical protein [Winogradskya humida]|uniref:Lipase maturation factor n=1 Tax=Winogradskya humida TaxID=113566 RepID=A0ABQ3ZZ45_9ACTN|nr:hypothetical protein [Actinoplanes humidus]GIE23876.1 hypothetical protein Ahu01nite_069780 [Actinoplanes humidus]